MIFKEKINIKINTPEIIFILFGLIFGIILIFITPRYEVPDEAGHYQRAIEISNGQFYNNPQKPRPNFNVNNISGYSPIMYLFSGIGIKLTSGFNENIQFYTGRFFNLFIWLALIASAIHITPVFKWQFFIIALLPMSIYEGMSYSADSFSNAFCFLFFAYIFKLIYKKDTFLIKKDLPILALLTIVGALCKGIIFPLLLVPFIPIKKHKLTIFLFLLFLSISISLTWSSHNFIAIRNNINPELNKYIILHFPQIFIQKIINTCIFHIYDWTKQLIGVLGLLTIKLDNIMYYLTIAIFMCSFIFIPEKYNIPLKHKIIGILTFLIYLFFVNSLLYYTWTPIDSKYIQGIQGRYFLSITPMLFILFGQNVYKVSDETQLMFKRIISRYMFLLLIYTIFILYRVYFVF